MKKKQSYGAVGKILSLFVIVCLLVSSLVLPVYAGTLKKSKVKFDYSKYSTYPYSWYMVRQKNHKKTRGGVPAGWNLNDKGAWYLNSDTKEKVIYLTFDCGYENGYTGKILDTLKKHKAHAIFFVTGEYIKERPDLIKKMKEEGHLVGNHTMHHPNLANCQVSQIKSEITETAKLMKKLTGYDMDLFVRPPAGGYSEQSLAVLKDMGYHTMFWSMAYCDWDANAQPGKQYVIDHFNRYCHPGAMPLMHVVSKSNAEALDTVLTNLEKAGYRFGTVDEFTLPEGTLEISCKNKKYDGMAAKIKVIKNTNKGAEVTFEIRNAKGKKVREAVKPGRYTVVASVGATRYYKAAMSRKVSFKITEE